MNLAQDVLQEYKKLQIQNTFVTYTSVNNELQISNAAFKEILC